MREQQTFTVDVAVSQTRRFRVDARTPEEAVDIAEGWFLEGEAGELITQELEGTEALPEEDLEGEAA